MKTITQTKLLVSLSLFFTLFYNYSFFANLIKVYTLEENLGFVLSIAFVISFFLIFLLGLVSFKYTIKPIAITLLLVSSMTSYFMNTYHVIIDATMIRNMMQTNIHESLDLLSVKQVLYFVFFGLLPAYYVYKIKLEERGLKQEFFSRIKLLLFSLAVIGVAVFSFSKHYTSFVREHKPLRFTINPTYWIYSTGKYINLTFNSAPLVVKPIGLDAKILDTKARKKIIIMVVGEASRADHFSLNGYERETNPLLAQEDIINLPNVFSCGTSTAVSVPCMFSKYDRSSYSYKKGISTENVLDVLKHTKKVAILWRDNNSDSKGVALRVPYEDYKTAQNNPDCQEGECRDIGMLVGLDKFIAKNKEQDILIVLHQMGNHGPAYYRRYTKEFEKFTPVCKTNQLEQCSKEAIANAYDNAILQTDTFLTKTIHFLKSYDKEYDTAMIYMSDHGESLGEGGVYLHGLPYFMAPDAQTHIGALLWFGERMKKELHLSAFKADKEYTQDALFSTLLGLFNVETKEYKKEMDMLHYEP